MNLRLQKQEALRLAADVQDNVSLRLEIASLERRLGVLRQEHEAERSRIESGMAQDRQQGILQPREDFSMQPESVSWVSSVSQSAVAEVQPSSAPQPSDKGGIDFRSLPIVTQPVNPALRPQLSPQLSGKGTLELSEEWKEIDRMLKAGITPSIERIKDYITASCSAGDAAKDLDKALSCIADILRLQEDQLIPTDRALEELLVLLESGKPTQEIPIFLAAIKVIPPAELKNKP